MIYKIEQYFKQYLSDPDNKVGTRNKEVRDIRLRKRLKEIKPGLRILDAGAGQLRYKSFCDHLKYASQDFNCYEGGGDGKALQNEKWNQKNLDIISDITAVPEPDASFDAIMCIEVLEHLPEPIKAIQEFARLLKQGGILILTAPFCSLTHFAPYHFCTGFNRYFYEKYLPANAFKIIELQENGNFFEYLGQEIRRIPSVAERYTQGRKYTRFESLAIKICLSMLERFSKEDCGSNELLHFGYHIIGEKK